MAIYHLHVSNVSRKTGRSAVAAAAYRSADKLHNEYDGLTHDYCEKSNAVNASAYRSGEKLTNDKDSTIYDYTKKRGVVHTEIMLPENAPREYTDRSTLWNAVEKAEKRKNARTARDIDVALPVELDRQEQIELMREYIQENFVDKGMIADFAIHDKGDGNPHAHILLTTREVDKSGFGKKNRDWNSKAYLQSWRENWASACNKRLQPDKHIDNRTLKAQGIDREPTIHIGVEAWNMEKKGIATERGNINREIIARNEARNVEKIAVNLHKLKEINFTLDKKITELRDVFDEAKREMNILRVKKDEITERAEYIQITKKRLDELRTEHKTSNRKQVELLERSHERAISFFKQSYNITPEQAESEITRLESQANSKINLQEKLQDKLIPFIEEKDRFMLEYQRQKLLAEINPNWQKIQDRVMQLDKENYPQSVQDRLVWTKAKCTLDKMTKENQEILKDVKPEQAKALIENREECERERSLVKGYIRWR